MRAGRVVLGCRPRRQQALDIGPAIDVDLQATIGRYLADFERILKDAEMRPVSFVQTGGIVAVSGWKPDQGFVVRYSGTVEKPGFLKTIGPAEATLSGTVWYPMIARHPATYNIYLHTPKNWTALAQGDPIGTSETATEKITRFRMDVPVVWFSASAGPYRTVASVIHGRRYQTMSQAMSAADMAIQNERNAEVVEFYSKTFCKYPFTQWTTLLSQQFQGGPGALEAYSFATYPDGDSPFLDAHEPSHTWWGGILNNDYLR